MINLDKIVSKIEANKEILTAFPTNNKKNIETYIQKLNELKEEFSGYKELASKEMEKRLNEALSLKENPELNSSKKELGNTEGVLYLLNDIETSYEKMDLDRAIQNLKYYYNKNLEAVNESILFCVKKFNEVGIEVKLEDFNYSNYVQEYFNTFFEELKNEDVNSKKIQTKFEEIYWKCPEIITHIELNITYIYLKNQKEIDKYFQSKKEALLKNFTAQDMMNLYMGRKKKIFELEKNDKSILIKKFIDGSLNVKNYLEPEIRKCYLQFINEENLDLTDEGNIDEINSNMLKLKNSIYEYKNYLKYKFIIDDIKNIYSEKDKYKNSYAQARKDIAKKESKIMALNKKINGNSIFVKEKSKLINERNNVIMEAKELYKNLGRDKVYNKAATELKDSSTLEEVLYFASSFYKYLYKCIKNDQKDIAEQEIEQEIEELREFVKWPYKTILSNIEIEENKDILLIIKDRYKLLDINITEEDLRSDNLDSLIDTLKKIEIANSVRRNKINLEEITYLCEFNKILNK